MSLPFETNKISNTSGEPAKEGTVRIEVELEKTGDDSFPEFSYVALVDELKKQNPNSKPPNGADKAAADLAAYFESKYGNFGNTAKFDKNKRKRRERIEDLMDMGEGYDANDEFIDDSDAHDVFVPQEYDTWHGGFYVNQGKLRFKMGDESEEVNLITGTKKRNLGLKRLDEEDEGGEDEDEADDEKENDDTQKNKNPKVPKPAQSAAQKIVAKAKKTHKVVAQSETNGLPSSTKTTEKPKPVLDLSKKTPTSPGRQSQRSPRSPARLIHEKHDVRVTSQQTAKTPSSQPDENDSLPTDCPSPLREKCENLRKIAELQTGLSSKQFFTPAVNQMLLEIEELSQSISQKIRSNIYSYLVKPMPCTRDTFVGRVKKIKTESCDNKLSMPHASLVLLVNKIMAEQEKKHKLLKEQHEIKLKEFTEKSPSDPSLKKPRNPQKSFHWNNEVKSCFSKLVYTKKELYGLSRPRGVTCEEWIFKYLEDEVKSIWPPGWMTSKQLEKLAKTIIGSDTSTKAAGASTTTATTATTSAIAKALPTTTKTVNNITSASSTTTATNLPPISSKLSPVVSLTPIKVESPTTAVPHGPITGQKRKLSEKSSNETPTLAKKKKEIHQKQQSAVSAQQQANAISELLASSGIQMPGITNQNSGGLNLQNAAVLQEIARQITQQKITQQNKKSPSSKKVENKKKTDTKSPKKVHQKNSAGQSPLKPNPLPNVTIQTMTTNGNRMTSHSPAKIGSIKLVPKSVPDVKIEAGKSKSPDLMIMSVTKPVQSPSKMKPKSNGNALPQPVLGNNIKPVMNPSSSKSNLKSPVSNTVNQLVNFGDYAKNMVSMSQPMNQSIGNQSTNQVVNLISNPMVQSQNIVSGGHPDSVASIIQSSKGLNYNYNQTSPQVSSTVIPSLVNPNSNNFSVQHLMTSSQVTSHNQTRPSIIHPVDNSKFTGGLNFSQIRQINTGHINGNGQFVTNQPTSVTSSSQGHHLKQMQQRNKQFQSQQQVAAVALANDLSLIEPTLPFSTTTTNVFTTGQQQQQLTQQQVNHNMNVQ